MTVILFKVSAMFRFILQPCRTSIAAKFLQHFSTAREISRLNHNIELEEHLASLIERCSGIRALRQIHAQLLANGLSAGRNFAISRIVAYCALSPSGDIDNARLVFAQIAKPNVFVWNSMIRGCCEKQTPMKESILLYAEMHRHGEGKANSFTFAFVLKACSILAAFEEGRQIHSQTVKNGLGSSPFVQTALVNLYSKCEETKVARQLFDEIPEKNLVAWSAMISGYSRVGQIMEALDLFREMQEAKVDPDEVTMVSVLSACARAGALDLGKWIHAYVDKNGIAMDVELSTALLDMYAKCGCIEKSRQLFDEMPERDTKAWSSMIVGLAIHGLAEDALEVLMKMEKAKIKPNHVTFIGVLSACAHSGLVSEGRRHFSSMRKFGIEPQMEHYGCMVDLLCRAGLIEEAYSFVERIPISPNSVIWRTLLVGCRNTRNLAHAESAAERLLELEPQNAENYVLLSNMYASSAQWDKVSHIRKKMKENGIKALPGCSTIEIDGHVHKFVVGDESHPLAQEIKEVLNDVCERIRIAGHEPSTWEVLHDIGDEEKELALCQHSERLAIAFGLLKTKAPTVIRVVKNLRVCGDCHEVTKIISEIFDREILVRDRVRFHRFVRGVCSCKDYW